MQVEHILDRLQCLGKVADTITDNTLNRGGCAVFAALVADALVKIGIDASGVVMMYGDIEGVDLNVARPKRRKARLDPDAWRSNGVSFVHVAVTFKIGRTTYFYDSENLMTKTQLTRKGRRLTPALGRVVNGTMTVEELKGISSTQAGWNEMFDRKRYIPKIEALTEQYLLTA